MSKVLYNLFWFILPVLLCCNTFCNNKSDIFLQLERIDDLLSSNNDSMATEIFKQIPQPKDSCDELAFYTYISVRMRCRKNDLFDPIILDYPIKYFIEKRDFHRLAYAYNYKSILLLDYSSDKYNALIYNNKAEELVQKIDNDLLKYNIFSNHSYIAMYYYDTQACIRNSLKSLEFAEKLQDTKRIAYSSMLLAMCYCDLKDFQEAEKYTDKCLNFIDNFDDVSKSMDYNTLGNIVKSSDSDLALKYYNKSNSIYNNSDACNNIAVLYLEQNRIKEADELFRKSLRPKAYEANTRLMKIFADKLFLTGNTPRVLEIYKQISAEQDSLLKVKEKNFELQFEKLNNRIEQRNAELYKKDSDVLFYKILAFCFIGLFLIMSLMYTLLKIKKQKEFNRRLQIMSRGEVFFNVIKTNECISQWSKVDREFFLGYYKSIDLEFKDMIDNEYDSLSINSELLLMLQKLGKNKQEIIDIMGFSDQAYRSLKSRTDRAKK